MSNKFTIHDNEYEKIQSKAPSRKPRWIHQENSTLFHTFSQTENRTKNQITAEKKLAQIGLSFGVLEEKYKVSQIVSTFLIYQVVLYG